MSRYYEEGYIDTNYFDEVIADTGTYYEEGYLENGYFVNDATGSVQEATANLTSVVAFTNIVDVIKQTSVDFNISVGFANIVEYKKQTSANLTSVVAFTNIVGIVKPLEADLTDAFIPTVTADGFKNSIAILDSVSSATAVANKTSQTSSAINVNTSVTANAEAIIGATEFAADLSASFTTPIANANLLKEVNVDAVSFTSSVANNTRIRSTQADASIAFETTIQSGSVKNIDADLLSIAVSSTLASRQRNIESDIVANANTITSVNKTVQLESAVDVEVAQTANVGKIVQGDIEAITLFTPGIAVEVIKNSFAILDNTVSMNATVNANRSNDVALNNIIALSLQAARSRDTASILLTSFEGVVNEARLRDYDSNLAFSFILGNRGDINNGIGVDTETSVTRQTNADFIANSTVAVSADRIRSSELDANANTLTQTYADRIRGVSANFTAFYTTANPITDSGTSIGGNSGDGSLVVTPVEASLSSTFELYALEDIRPLQVRITDINGLPQNDPPSILSSTDRFKIGSASIRTGTQYQSLSAFLTDDIFDIGTGDFTLEYWVDHNGSDAQFASVYIGGEYLAVQFRRLQDEIIVSTSTPSYTFTFDVNLTDVVGEFDHIAIVRHNGVINLYINGESASTSGNRDFSGFNVIEATRFQIFPHTLTHYYDEIRLSTVARYTSNFTTRLTPFSNDSNTVLLIHGDGNVKDSIEVLNTAELFATTAISADITETKLAELGADTTATLTADANIIKDINALASTTASLQATVGKVLQYASDATASTTASATAGIVKQFSADAGVLFTPNFDANASINYTAILDTTATLTASGDKSSDYSAQLTVTVEQASIETYLRNTGADATANFAIDLTVDKLKTAGASISGAFTASVTALNVQTLQGAGAFTSEFASNVNVGNIISGAAELTSAFTPTLIYKFLVIDSIVYVVPREDRTFAINTESRLFTIADETRLYQVGA